MFKPRFTAAVLLLAVGAPIGAYAQSTSELDAIRKQIDELKNNYENTIRALEQRLKDAETAAAQADAKATQA